MLPYNEKICIIVCLPYEAMNFWGQSTLLVIISHFMSKSLMNISPIEQFNSIRKKQKVENGFFTQSIYYDMDAFPIWINKQHLITIEERNYVFNPRIVRQIFNNYLSRRKIVSMINQQQAKKIGVL